MLAIMLIADNNNNSQFRNNVVNSFVNMSFLYTDKFQFINKKTKKWSNEVTLTFCV